MTWPFLTIELKSAPSHEMLPDTWLPTCTVVTAWSVPDRADGVDDVAARDSGVVWTVTSGPLRNCSTRPRRRQRQRR